MLTVFPLRLELFKEIRKEYVSRGRLMSIKHMTHAEQDVEKAELFELFASRQLAYLLPFALRAQAASLTKRLANGLLGSAGGVGSTWGLSLLGAYHPETNPHPAKVRSPSCHDPSPLGSTLCCGEGTVLAIPD